VLKKKIWANFQRIIEPFTQKIVTKLSKIWVWDPRSGGSGKNLFRISDPGVKKAPDPGYGSATLTLSIQYMYFLGPHVLRRKSLARTVYRYIQELDYSSYNYKLSWHVSKAVAWKRFLYTIIILYFLFISYLTYLHPECGLLNPPRRYRYILNYICSARDWDGKDYLRIIPRVVLVEVRA
jgi:hypothetical protein